MSHKAGRLVSNGVFAVVVALFVLWVWLTVVHPDVPNHPDDAGSGPALAALGLATLFAGTGGLIVRRHPRNSVGWIFCILALIYAVGVSLGSYAWISFNQDEWWPLTRAAGYLADVTFGNPASFGPFVFFFLLFPDGRLPSRRWRVLAYVAAFSIAGLFVNGAFRPDTLNPIPIRNPLGLEALQPFREVLDVTSFGGLVVSLFGSVAALIVRLRRSRGDERQQIKWFLTAAGVLTTVIALAPFTFFRPSAPTWLWPFVLLSSLSLIPVAAAVAILKYRLYDIDVIINRALVYGSLTALLAGSYLTIVVLLQRFLEPLRAESDLAIAASTLAVAALFSPLRSRVQSFIDRRFYRRRYDAGLAVEGFSRRLRDEIQLEAVADDLASVVRETVQPAHLGLWLPDPSGVDISS